MLSVNQIKTKYVGDATSFHLWLTIEKQNFYEKKGLNADDESKKFETWLNKRYTAGGTSFWQRVFTEKSKKAEASNSADTLEAVKVPFLKRPMVMGMTPVTLGLGFVGVIALSIATVQIIKYAKRKNKK